MKRKLSAAFILMMILLISLSAALAAEPLTSFHVHLDGDQTSGITFTVSNVYFDGYLLDIPITMAPTDSNTKIYENVLGDYTTSPEIEAMQDAGFMPLGAYCDIQLFDAAGQETGSLMTGTGEPVGSAYKMVFRFHFLSNEKPDVLHAKVICGVMETPGKTVGDMQVFDCIVPDQKPVYTKSVPVTGNAVLPGLEEVFIAQTEKATCAYAFFDGNTLFNDWLSLSFGESEAGLSAMSDTGYDPTHDKFYLYHAAQTSVVPTNLYIRDTQSQREYVIQLAEGSVTLIENQ